MQIITNYRYYILLVLGTITAVGVFSEPLENLSTFPWLKVLFISKMIGIAAGYTAYQLIKLWDKRNKIPELSNLIKDED